MTAGRRWWIVGLGVLLLVAAPLLVRALPVSDPAVPPRVLLERIQSSGHVSFSGYALSTGHTALPADEGLSGLAGLIGDTNRVRVWWRDPQIWRTSTLRATGETDLVHSGGLTVRWVYESKTATVYPDVPVRLPTAADILPHELARRMLAGARQSELTRIPARRVAGRATAGLRLTPTDEQAAIGRVDVYADRATGVPLQVEVFAQGSTRPALTSRFLDFTVGTPSAAALTFHPPDDARIHHDRVVDLAAAADEFAARIPPRSLAGLPARGPGLGSAGVYGRGPTVLLAVPLWQRTSERVRESLDRQPGVQKLDQGLLVDAEPMRLLLATPEHNDNSWLLVGTVTQQALTDAADQLATHRPELRLLS